MDVIAKEYSKISKYLNYLQSAIIGFLVIVILVMFIKIKSLEKTIETKVYVSVDNKLYEARPESRGKKIKEDYQVFASTFAYNMFGHDINSLEERLELVKPLIYEKGYAYILSQYNEGKEGGWEQGIKNLENLYKTRDARTYFSIDSITNYDQQGKYTFVEVYGKQKAVFAVGKDQEVPLNFKIRMEDLAKSAKNPFGIWISKFDFVYVKTNEN